MSRFRVALFFAVLSIALASSCGKKSSSPTAPKLTTSQPHAFLLKWGSPGVDPGQFAYPIWLAVDAGGNVYTSDTKLNRVQKFSGTGALMAEWTAASIGDGPTIGGNGIASDGGSVIYVLGDGVVRKLSTSGVLITKWGSSGTDDGQFQMPRAIAVDPGTGDVYVADSGLNRIQKFSSDGTFLTKWGATGAGNGQFDSPEAIAVNANHYVFVVDTNNHRIQKFASTGAYDSQWGSAGAGDGQFKYPAGIAIDADGEIYVSDSAREFPSDPGNHRIQVFGADGAFVGKWGSYGSGDGQFHFPQSIAMDANGNCFVADEMNDRIEKFGP
jgi:DNA-binding beta-propeller fold protein YncE